MKMLSMILYKDVATLAITAGTEYLTNSEPILLVPRSLGALAEDVFVVSAIQFSLKKGNHMIPTISVIDCNPFSLQ